MAPAPTPPMQEFALWAARAAQGVVAAVVLALAGWVWTAESRFTRGETTIAMNIAKIAQLQTAYEALRDQTTDIALIKQDVGYLRATVDDLRRMLKDKEGR